MEIPNQEEKEKKQIQGYFSQEFYMNQDELSNFLRDLADEIEKGEEIKITSDEWVLPFTPRKQAEVEIELEESELEIEIEFEKAEEKGSEISIE